MEHLSGLWSTFRPVSSAVLLRGENEQFHRAEGLRIRAVPEMVYPGGTGAGSPFGLPYYRKPKGLLFHGGWIQ